MPAPTVFNAPTSMWVHAAAIADPSGGLTVDAEARTATNAILAALRDKGVIASAAALNTRHTWNAATSQVVLGPAIADPSGGTTVDADARTAIGSILTVLRVFGVVAGATGGPSLVLDEDTGAVSTAAIADLSTATGDAECRTALNSALAALRSRNLIAQD